MRMVQLRHEFVDHVPNELADGIVYVCIPYATAVHKCCCGCGNEVITPLSPTDWQLIFNGRSISLKPSIGNWSFECQSHYWIQNNQVRWAPHWTRERIDAGRARDRAAKEREFAPASRGASEQRASNRNPIRRFFRAIRAWLRK